MHSCAWWDKAGFGVASSNHLSLFLGLKIDDVVVFPNIYNIELNRFLEISP